MDVLIYYGGDQLNHKIHAKSFLFITLLSISSKACGVGIPRIENGEWANKDSIYSNCEKCYSGNEKEILDCKSMYNRSAEDQIIEIERQRNEALDYIPTMVKEFRKTNFTPSELCYFPKKYPNCQNSKDTLEMVLNLKIRNIENLDVQTLMRYVNFLRGLKERKKDVNQFKNILLIRPKEIKAKDVTLSLVNMIAFEQVEDGIVNLDHWLYLFGKYSLFVDGCGEYESFKKIAESNNLLNAIFISQSEYGQNNRDFNGISDFTDVTYSSVKKGIAACLLLKGDDEKIAYGNDYIYGECVGNTIWALTRLYEKEVLGAITDDERKKKENEFLSELSLNKINPIINNLKKYDRHIRRELHFGTQTDEMFLQLKRIYNLK